MQATNKEGWGYSQPMFPLNWATVTPDDAVEFEPSAIYVVEAGDVEFEPAGIGAVDTLTMAAGQWLPVMVCRVLEGTTATVRRSW